MKNFNLLFLASILFLLSCSPKQKSREEIKSINLNELAQEEIPAKTSDLFNSINYIVLESNDSCIMADALSCKILDITTSHILIKSGRDDIMLFNSQGKFINTIGKPGDGPAEFSSVYSGKLDETSVYLLDETMKSVIQYDLEGNFISRTTRHNNSSSIIPVELIGTKHIHFEYHPSLVANTDSINYDCIIRDFEGNPIVTFNSYEDVPANLKEGRIMISGQVYDNNKETFYLSPFTDTLYRVDMVSKVYEPYMILNRGEARPQRIIAEDIERKQKEKANIIEFGLTHVNDTQIWTVCNLYGKSIGIVAIERESMKVLYQKTFELAKLNSYSDLGIENDMTGPKYIMPKFSKDKYSYDLIDCGVLSETGIEQFNNLSEDDNPVLLIAEVK